MASPAPAGPSGKVVKLKDPKADLRNASGGVVTGHGIVDVVGVSGQIVKGQLVVKIQVVGKIPASYSTTKAEINYIVAVERDESGDSDYWVALTNREDGSWVAELTVWDTSDTLAAEQFPGTGTADNRTVSLRVDLAALGSPHTLRLSVISQVANAESGDVLAEDQVPAGQQYLPSKKWLTLVVPAD